MKFKNKPNEFIKAEDGREFWISRAPAVTASIAISIDAQQYVLLNKRGSGCPDYVGWWVLPCGYLDWDESGGDAAIREVWEECGLNLGELRKDANCSYGGIFTNDPWSVVSDPNIDPQQNIVFHFGAAFNADKLPRISAENCEHNEVDEVKWFKKEDALKMRLAYTHESVIKRFFNTLAVIDEA
jgi:8-oxo-dGTP pyrophosphatase MutT (NUDIX family)